uniref:Uncharacterized protein n=1 Tax=Medicago truncatula TaxID=3880 RepID=Q1S5L1_MEDTR|nr:hypothetical protein MtrDRAFT_AC147431g44v2 [Medicago truncatula]
MQAHHLHGRVISTKGPTPLMVVALKSNLSNLWKSPWPQNFVSLLFERDTLNYHFLD